MRLCCLNSRRRPAARWVRLWDFAGATTIGALPRAFAYAGRGGSIGNCSFPQALVAIGVLIAMTIAGAALVWHLGGGSDGQTTSRSRSRR